MVHTRSTKPREPQPSQTLCTLTALKTAVSDAVEQLSRSRQLGGHPHEHDTEWLNVKQALEQLNRPRNSLRELADRVSASPASSFQRQTRSTTSQANKRQGANTLQEVYARALKEICTCQECSEEMSDTVMGDLSRLCKREQELNEWELQLSKSMSKTAPAETSQTEIQEAGTQELLHLDSDCKGEGQPEKSEAEETLPEDLLQSHGQNCAWRAWCTSLETAAQAMSCPSEGCAEKECAALLEPSHVLQHTQSLQIGFKAKLEDSVDPSEKSEALALYAAFCTCERNTQLSDTQKEAFVKKLKKSLWRITRKEVHRLWMHYYPSYEPADFGIDSPEERPIG